MITETTVDGVRTLLAHQPGPGPVTAGLLFRVGRADETLATSGITHLVEHLALHRHVPPGDPHHDGATAPAHTGFQVTGTPAEVVAYLNGVCASLRDLPVERLETEKEILRTEPPAAAAVRPASPPCGATDPAPTASPNTPKPDSPSSPGSRSATGPGPGSPPATPSCASPAAPSPTASTSPFLRAPGIPRPSPQPPCPPSPPSSGARTAASS
ncbi:hypothetical protein J7E97_07175 [Streptomyces sp. ISL-66]|uniref:hypothetical protein n=1 Tax=Streptomyces sp. ISL-66 TaxID=2819186 RepID=UPI001BEA2542|nr:hypothetical protein [Streptomyces sp. ISL-66]MBT2467655.1 hypothetical protein [Streptomyces sp. ISL-66]